MTSDGGTIAAIVLGYRKIAAVGDPSTK